MEKRYMNKETGSIDTYEGWFYENESGETVNAVDLGEVVEVQDCGIVENEHGLEIDYRAAVQMMDDELREMINGDTDAQTEQAFFYKYCQVHYERFGEVFEPNKSNPVW